MRWGMREGFVSSVWGRLEQVHRYIRHRQVQRKTLVNERGRGQVLGLEEGGPRRVGKEGGPRWPLRRRVGSGGDAGGRVRSGGESGTTHGSRRPEDPGLSQKQCPQAAGSQRHFLSSSSVYLYLLDSHRLI